VLDPATVAATWDQVRDQLGDRFPKIATLMDDAKAEVLAFSSFPRATGRRCGRPTRSWTSARTAPTSRMTEASVGKIPHDTGPSLHFFVEPLGS